YSRCSRSVMGGGGTPQGTGISPLLANIFLHYVLDLWVHQWRRRHAFGRVSIVRYADDFVMGFEKAADARRMLVDLKDRLAKFGLALHEDKTRLIEFGRLPALRRQQRGERRLETFAFLGFTHYLRVDAGWPVYREAQDAKQAPDAQADGAAPGGMAAHARANGRAATLVRQHPARSLRLLWAAEQLPRVERVSSGGPAHLVPLPPAAQSEGPEPHLGP